MQCIYYELKADTCIEQKTQNTRQDEKPFHAMLTFVALGIFVGQLIYPGIGVLGDDRGQDPIRTVWIDLYRGQIIWRLRHFECATALEEAAKTNLFKV